MRPTASVRRMRTIAGSCCACLVCMWWVLRDCVVVNCGSGWAIYRYEPREPDVPLGSSWAVGDRHTNRLEIRPCSAFCGVEIGVGWGRVRKAELLQPQGYARW